MFTVRISTGTFPVLPNCHTHKTSLLYTYIYTQLSVLSQFGPSWRKGSEENKEECNTHSRLLYTQHNMSSKPNTKSHTRGSSKNVDIMDTIVSSSDSEQVQQQQQSTTEDNKQKQQQQPQPPLQQPPLQPQSSQQQQQPAEGMRALPISGGT